MKLYNIKPFKQSGESFNLIVTETTEQLRKEINTFYKKWKRKEDVRVTVLGMFSPTAIMVECDYPGTFTSDVFGHMFLAEEMLGQGYITHECLHAAMAHERSRQCFDMNYGDGCNEHEERLAACLTECLIAVWNTLMDNGHCKARPK